MQPLTPGAFAARLGIDTEARVERFECCDTTFTVHCKGLRSKRAIDRASGTARRLEEQLNAFDDTSAVATLNRTGSVANEHVATVVGRGLEYRTRTDGVFDVTHGTLEESVKAYLDGARDRLPEMGSRSAPANVTVDGRTVTTDRRLDVNGLAKGYIVDRVADELRGGGRTGFVDGGGDITRPTGPVAVESPFGDSEPITVLDTDWNVATSGGYNRRRGTVDHIYDPRTGRLGSRHDLVTVVADRDSMEADALATTLSVLPFEAALDLATRWTGSEALILENGIYHRTPGFRTHEAAN